MALTRVETTQSDWQAGTLSNVVATTAGDLILNNLYDNPTNSIDSTKWETSGTVATDGTNIVVGGTSNGFCYLASLQKWKVPTDASTLIVEFVGVLPFTALSYAYVGLGIRNASWNISNKIVFYSDWRDQTKTYAYVDGVSNTALDAKYADGTARTYRIEVTSTQAKFYVNGTLKATVNHSLAGVTVGFVVQTYDANQYAKIDWVKVYNNSLSGARTSPALDLSSIGTAASSKISWTASTPTNTAVAVDVSLDGGATWQSATNGSAIPGITPGMNLSGKSLLVRQTLSTTDPIVTPTLSDLTVTIGSVQTGTATSQASGTATGSARRFVFAVAPASAVATMEWNERIQAVRATAMAEAMMSANAIRLLIQTLMVNAIIQPGDIVEIDTAKMTVKINGVNALQYVEGDFFSLLPGTNYLEYRDSEAQRNVQVITRHRARWL